MALDINPALKAEATIKNHRLQKANNHMAEVVLPITLGGSCAMESSSDARIIDKMNMHSTNLSPTAVSFPT